MNLLLISVTPFVGAIITAAISRLGRLHSAWAAVVITLFTLLLLLPLIPDIFAGQVIIQRFSWIPWPVLT